MTRNFGDKWLDDKWKEKGFRHGVQEDCLPADSSAEGMTGRLRSAEAELAKS